MRAISLCLRNVFGLLLCMGVSLAEDTQRGIHQFDEGPASVDLRAFLPAPQKQTKNDCVAWSFAYVSFSCQICQERQITQPTRKCDLFSPSFVYSELAGDNDDGLDINAAINFAMNQGCASLETMPLDSAHADSAARREAGLYKATSYAKVESLTEIRRHLSGGFPVILVIRNDQVFNRREALPEPFRWQKTSQQMDADFEEYGPHAVTAVGYDDAKQAVLVMNSLGTEWKDGGFCWVHYDNLLKIPGDRTDVSPYWCLVARVLKIKEGLPAMASMEHKLGTVRFQLDANHEVGIKNDSRRLSPARWRVEDIACNDQTVFLLRKDHLVARLNEVVEVLNDDRKAVWSHLDKGLPQNSEVIMIAATTGTPIHALTRKGQLFQFSTGQGKWSRVVVLNSEDAAIIDLRDNRSQGPLSITTIRGRVFTLDIDEGWTEL